MRLTERRLPRLLAVGVLTGGIGVSILGAGTAGAAACGPPIAVETACTLTGTVVLSSGSMTLTSPNALGWSAVLNGLDQHLVDATTAHQTYLVNDASGASAGWKVTVSATTFTTAGALVLPNSGTFATNGSITSMASAAVPTATCSSGATCTLPTNTTVFPVAITTAASPTAVTIYNAAINTGLGSIVIGLPGANPVGWWVNVPSNTLPGSYLSTVSLMLSSGP